MDPVTMAMIPTGIAAVVLISRWAYGGAMATLPDLNAAIARFHLDFPDDQVVGGVLSADRQQACLELADGALGLVQAFGGQDFICRRCQRGDITAISRDNQALTLKFGDFTLPELTINLADSAGIWHDKWSALLERH